MVLQQHLQTARLALDQNRDDKVMLNGSGSALQEKGFHFLGSTGEPVSIASVQPKNRNRTTVPGFQTKNSPQLYSFPDHTPFQERMSPFCGLRLDVCTTFVDIKKLEPQ